MGFYRKNCAAIQDIVKKVSVFLFTVNLDYGMICYLNRDLDGIRLNKVEDWRKKGVKRVFKRGAHPLSFPLHYSGRDIA